MPQFRLPLSGGVTQFIQPWTEFYGRFMGQVGLVNINLGKSRAPEIEAEILEDVGSYGRQLGRIGDALAVLIKHADLKGLNEEEQKAVDSLQCMLREIDAIKKDAAP